MSDEGITCPHCGSDDISFTMSLELTGVDDDPGFGIDKLTCDNCGFEMSLDGDSLLALSDILEAATSDEDEDEGWADEEDDDWEDDEESVDPDWDPIQVSAGPGVEGIRDDAQGLSSGLGPEVASDVLLECASAQIYRRNAFRITELPVDATTRDIGKEMDRLRMMEKLGGAGKAGSGPLALDPPPDADAMREAMQRLHDPEQRMVDELFWFWPMELGQGQSDEGTALLSKGDVRGAAALWMRREREGSEANVSVHNLAVLSHATALDLELSDGEESAGTEERDRWWKEGLKRWGMILDDQRFWSRITARIREMDDPRLTTGTARRMQASLPLTLLMINAQLALRAAERREWDDARRHVGILRSSDFEEEVVDEALKRILEPLRGRIQMLAKTAEDEGDAEPERSKECAKRLLKQAKPLLEIVDCLLEPGDPTRTAIHDEVALRILGCEITYGNTTEDWKGAEGILKPSLKVVEGEAARTRIEQNLSVVKSNKDLQKTWGVCWFCGENKPEDEASVDVQMFGEVTRTPTFEGTQLTWQKGEIGVPRCEDCEEAHLTKFLWFLWYPFVWFLAVLAVPIALIRFVPRFRRFPTPKIGAFLGFSVATLLFFAGQMVNGAVMGWGVPLVGTARSSSSIASLREEVREAPDNDELWGDLGDAIVRTDEPGSAGAYAVAHILDPDDSEWSGKVTLMDGAAGAVRSVGITDDSFVGILALLAIEMGESDAGDLLCELADSLNPEVGWSTVAESAPPDVARSMIDVWRHDRFVSQDPRNDEMWGDLGDEYSSLPGGGMAADACYAVARLLDTRDGEWRGHSPNLSLAAEAVRAHGIPDRDLVEALQDGARTLGDQEAQEALEALALEIENSEEADAPLTGEGDTDLFAFIGPEARTFLLISSLPLAVGLLGALFGGMYGRRLRRKKGRPEEVKKTKPEGAKIEFPPIKERLRKGWELGEKPSEAYE